jgi:poly-gamma-glutamate capsule biosynthesis protein CapA/YwtB (metallophosphatase superfamily)
MNYKFLILIILLIALAIVFSSALLPFKEESWERGEINSSEEAENEDKAIRLFFVGDVMFDRGVEHYLDKYGQGDFRFPFLNIKEKLEEGDLLFGNLEGSISDRGNRVGSIYSFRFRPEAISGLTFAGFDMLSLANNHMLDYQRIALEDTMNILRENGIDYVGAGFNKDEAFSVRIKEVKGIRIGFLAYTNLGTENWKAGENYSGMAWINKSNIESLAEDIKVAKENVDILIISLHSGEEYAKEPNNFQVLFSQRAIVAGADLIVGHHPHVVQGIEEYIPLIEEGRDKKKGWIAYSLGNFVFDQSFSQETMESIILTVEIKEKEINEVGWEKIRMNQYYQPALVNK